MTKKLFFAKLLLALYLCHSSASAALPPGIMNHQGRIVVDGVNYDGTGYFKFSFVTTVEAFFVTVWSNDGTGSGISEPDAAVEVTVSNGHYSVLLGDTALSNMTEVIPASVFSDNDDVNLHVWFSTDNMTFERLTPDRRIVTSAYAFSASEIDGGSVKNPAFLGTTEDAPLEVKVNGLRALRVQPGSGSDSSSVEFQTPLGTPSIVGGSAENSAGNLEGAVISGGGQSVTFGPETGFGGGFFSLPNIISGSGNFATISGGRDNLIDGQASTVGGGDGNLVNNAENATISGGKWNTASGNGASIGGGQNNVASGRRATVPGGDINTAQGNESLAAGRGAKALHDGTFVWADSDGQNVSAVNFESTDIDQFLIRAGGGVGIGTNDPQAALDVVGTVRASAFESASGSTLTFGTLSDEAVEFKVNSIRGFGLQAGNPALNALSRDVGTDSVSLLGGYWRNTITQAVDGATISGGGGNFYGFSGEIEEERPNQILASGDYGTIAGGRGNLVNGMGATVSGGELNMANGEFSTVPGGRKNEANADFSSAAGRRAIANHDGAFVWADSTDADFASTAVNQFLVRASGGVGINEADPKADLHISNTAQAQIIIAGDLDASETLGDDSSIQFSTGNSFFGAIGMSAGSGNLFLNTFEISGTDPGDIILQPQGNVGINTIDPQDLLHMTSTTGVRARVESTTSYAGFLAKNSTEDYFMGVSAIGRWELYDNNGEGLPVRMSTETGGAMYINANNNNDALVVTNIGTGDNSDGIQIFLGPASNVGPNHNYLEFLDGDGTFIGQVEGNGVGGVSYNSTSDRRLKQDIVDLPDALGIVNRLNAREFAYRTAPDVRQAGFIAQEVLEVYPQAASGDPEGDVDEEPMMVNYSAFTPVLTGAVKELNTKMESQQAEIHDLRQENEALKQRLLRLEQAMESANTPGF